MHKKPKSSTRRRGLRATCKNCWYDDSRLTLERLNEYTFFRAGKVGELVLIRTIFADSPISLFSVFVPEKCEETVSATRPPQM